MMQSDKDRQKRVHRVTIAFNSDQQKLVDGFCEKYNISNRSKLFRELIITAMLQKLEQDHPKLF